jgi:RNA polymerase sigma-70 factor, ECF subfamily
MPSMPSEHLSEHTEESLLQQVAHKHVDAFEVLYHRHAQVMYNLIFRIVRQQKVAEELLQDTFWQIWLRADQYEHDNAGTAWMYAIARRRALDYLHAGEMRPPGIENGVTTVPEVAAQDEMTNAEKATVEGQRQQVLAALRKLPEAQRACLVLAYFAGLSHSEIAAQTNSAPDLVNIQIRSGLENFAQSLATFSRQGDNPSAAV